jgi:hypothetical protein
LCLEFRKFFYNSQLQNSPKGFEPLNKNQQAVNNKALTKNENPVLSTGLDKTLQKYTELKHIAEAWPKLSEHIKAAIKALIQICKTEKK